MSISKFKKTKTRFLSLFIALSSIFPFSSRAPPSPPTPPQPPPPLPVLCLLHSPPPKPTPLSPNPLRLCFSVPLVFPYIPSPPSPPLTLSSVAFHRLCGSEPGEGIGGIRLFLSDTRENCGETLETTAVKPLPSADCARARPPACVTPSLLCASPQLPPSYAAAGVGC